MAVKVERQIVGTENNFTTAKDGDINKIRGTELVNCLHMSFMQVEWRGVRGGSQKGGREEHECVGSCMQGWMKSIVHIIHIDVSTITCHWNALKTYVHMALLVAM